MLTQTIMRTLERKARTATQTTASDLESRLRRTSPVDTGNMRAHTTVKTTPTANGARIDIKVDTPYAHIVRSGQRPHPITARSPTGVLRFIQGGVVRFARSVNHPGAQGNSWFDDALRDAPDLLARNWRNTR